MLSPSSAALALACHDRQASLPVLLSTYRLKDKVGGRREAARRKLVRLHGYVKNFELSKVCI